MPGAEETRLKILVTGSSGFIGGPLVEALAERGHQVVGVDRREPTGPAPQTFVRGDLMDDDVLRRALAGVDCVFHLAAARTDWGPSDETFFRENLEVTERVLTAGRAREIKKWFFFSTVGVYGPSERPLDEETPPAPVNAYGASKAEAEERFQAFAGERPDAEVMIIRPSAVFGPESPPNTNIYRLIEAVRGRRFVMIGDGGNHKTTSYLGNLVPATLFLFDRLRPGVQIYNYVDQPVLSMAELVAETYALLGKRGPALRLPLGLARRVASLSDLTAKLVRVDIPITAARIEKFCTATHFSAAAIQALGFSQPVSNSEALAETVRWHREHVG